MWSLGVPLGCPMPWAQWVRQNTPGRGFLGWETCCQERWLLSKRFARFGCRCPLLKGPQTRVTIFLFSLDFGWLFLGCPFSHFPLLSSCFSWSNLNKSWPHVPFAITCCLTSGVSSPTPANTVPRSGAGQEPGKKIQVKSRRSFSHPQPRPWWGCPLPPLVGFKILGSEHAVSAQGTNQLSKVYLYECSQLFPLHKFTQRLSWLYNTHYMEAIYIWMNVFIERKARSSCSPPLNWNGRSGCPVAIPDQQRCVSRELTDFWF